MNPRPNNASREYVVLELQDFLVPPLSEEGGESISVGDLPQEHAWMPVGVRNAWDAEQAIKDHHAEVDPDGEREASYRAIPVKAWGLRRGYKVRRVVTRVFEEQDDLRALRRPGASRRGATSKSDATPEPQEPGGLITSTDADGGLEGS